MNVTGPNTVLLIDRDSKLSGKLSSKLLHAGYLVDTAVTAADGLILASRRPYDVIIIDPELPDINGMEICKKLREQGFVTPIIMTSGQEGNVLTIRCLELGADDYLRKPFSHNELIARLRAMVRRSRKSYMPRWIENNGVRLNVQTCIVAIDHQKLSLTKKETLLLKRLMLDSPESVSRDCLMRDVWGIDELHTSNRLDVYIRRLRAKLEKAGRADFIKTVRGQGYCIEAVVATRHTEKPRS